MGLNFDQIIKSIEQLPEPDQERIRRWLETKEASNGDADISQAHVSRSVKSLRLLDEHREEYSGQWVTLDGDRLIASGSTAKEVYSKAKAEGVEIPFVELVTAQDSLLRHTQIRNQPHSNSSLLPRDNFNRSHSPTQSSKNSLRTF